MSKKKDMTPDRQTDLDHNSATVPKGPSATTPDIVFQPGLRARSAVRQMICGLLKIAARNVPGIIDDADTEHLHDFRVSMRKVRSILTLLKTVYPVGESVRLKTAAAEFGKQTNALRDLDVYLLERDTYMKQVPESLTVGLERMFDDFEKRRRRELAKMKRYLRSKTFTTSFEQLQAFFIEADALPETEASSAPVLQLGQTLIYERYRKVCSLGMAIHEDTPDAEVHKLRIQCKKLRYLLQFFSSLFPAEKMKLFEKKLKRLQTQLGVFNDVSVQQEALHDYIADTAQGKAVDEELALSVGALIANLHRTQLGMRDKIMAEFKVFDGAKVHGVFEELFHPKQKPKKT